MVRAQLVLTAFNNALILASLSTCFICRLLKLRVRPQVSFDYIRQKVRKSIGDHKIWKVSKEDLNIWVISNLTFFQLPIIVGLLWLFTRTFNNISLQTREILVGSFTTVCFSIKLFLNPLLYAFRDRRFRLTIKERCYHLLHPNTTFVQQLNDKTEVETRSQLGDVKQNK